ncbi:MAG: ABC-type amino acid transport substrate-binding protein [Halopseudomonas sp.]
MRHESCRIQSASEQIAFGKTILKTVRYLLSTAALGAALLLSVLAPRAYAEPVQVKVGGYSFPPFVNRPADGQWSGLTLDVIAAMNARQDDYQFVFFSTSASRRYHDFDDNQYDMMLFESPDWGWQGKSVVSLHGPVTGREVFIAKAAEGRGQDYFAQRQSKRIALFSGYHYAFTGFNPDRDYLRKEHGAAMTFSHESIIQMVLRERAEFGVVTEAFLQQYLAQYPEHQGQLLVSEKADQHYRHALIMRQGSVPGISYMDDLFQQLRNQGELSRLMALHGLADAD